MTMYQKVKDKALEVNDKLDAAADEQVNKVKESRFTWAILGGSALAILTIFVLLAKY